MRTGAQAPANDTENAILLRTYSLPPSLGQCFKTRQFLSMCVLSICPSLVVRHLLIVPFRFSQVHLVWYLVAPLIASAILYGIDKRDSPYVDLLFLSVSALTVTGACLPQYPICIYPFGTELSEPRARSTPQVSIRYSWRRPRAHSRS